MRVAGGSPSSAICSTSRQHHAPPTVGRIRAVAEPAGGVLNEAGVAQRRCGAPLCWLCVARRLRPLPVCPSQGPSAFPRQAPAKQHHPRSTIACHGRSYSGSAPSGSAGAGGVRKFSLEPISYHILTPLRQREANAMSPTSFLRELGALLSAAQLVRCGGISRDLHSAPQCGLCTNRVFTHLVCRSPDTRCNALPLERANRTRIASRKFGNAPGPLAMRQEWKQTCTSIP